MRLNIWKAAAVLVYSTRTVHGYRIQTAGLRHGGDQQNPRAHQSTLDVQSSAPKPNNMLSSFVATTDSAAGWQPSGHSHKLVVKKLCSTCKDVFAKLHHCEEDCNTVPPDDIAGHLCESIQWRCFRKRTRCLSVCMIDVLEDDGTLHEKLLEFQEVADTLKADVPQLLEKEPNWDIFATDFKMIDQTGAKLEGLDVNKNLLKLFRRMYKKYVSEEDDLELKFIDERDEPPAFIVAQWKVRVGSQERPFFDFFLRDNPVEIEVETVFHLNDQGRIDSARIDKWLANGHYFPVKMQLWPEVLLTDDRIASIKKIKEWERSIQVLKPLRPSAVDSIRGAVPSRREVLLQVAAQVVVQAGLLLFLGKKVVEDGLDGVAGDQEADAVRNLQALIPDILVKEPDWANFAEDFKMVDQTGVTVFGLGPNKFFLQLLREVHSQLAFTPLKDDYRVQTEIASEVRPDGTREPVVTSRWMINIDTRRRPPIISDARWNLETSLEARALDLLQGWSFPLSVSGNATFRFNQERKVSCVSIDSWTVNGQELKLPLHMLPSQTGMPR